MILDREDSVTPNSLKTSSEDRADDVKVGRDTVCKCCRYDGLKLQWRQWEGVRYTEKGDNELLWT